MIKLVSELIVKQTLDFAIAARRAIELEDLPRLEVLDLHRRNGLRVDADPFKGSFREALGMIIHSKEIVVVTHTTGNELYVKMGDRQTSHIRVQSDKGEAYICPFGLAHTYLSRHGVIESARQGQDMAVSKGGN